MLIYDWCMTDHAQEVLREALTLSARDRADLAAELLTSLDEHTGDDPRDVRAAWDIEIDRRVREDLANEQPGETWDDLRSRLSTTR